MVIPANDGEAGWLRECRRASTLSAEAASLTRGDQQLRTRRPYAVSEHLVVESAGPVVLDLVAAGDQVIRNAETDRG